MTTEPSPEPTVDRASLKERLETKIEEYREAQAAYMARLKPIGYDAGVQKGLELALQILEES